ncbi:MAG TPA: potassium-transporting ATPase subunit KdpC [Ignavibacteriaceae bacterium]|nr:potassium-transporting ATPase subunit KdpC [Ignavibacteriaceae bacterium]
MKTIIKSFLMLLLLTILTGIVYPVAITVIGQLLFPSKANGSLIIKNHKIIGSELLGQSFTDSIYFHSRPSVINYNPLPSGASNLGLSSSLLKEQVNSRKFNFTLKNLLPDTTLIPAEMIFASASGVDPHISVESAKLQVNRILQSRDIPNNKAEFLFSLIDSLTEYPQFWVLGNKGVNVLLLNLKLDKEYKKWIIQN